MSTDTHARQPAGTPAGGQFATTAKTEPELALTSARRIDPLTAGTDVKTGTYGYHGAIKTVHDGCPEGAAWVACQRVPIRPEALEPGYPWYTVVVHAGGAVSVPHYDIALTDSLGAASADLRGALDTLSKAERVIAKATTHMIAMEVLKAEPEAAYLELFDEDGDYGQRVRTGRVLDADGHVLYDDVEDIETDGGAPSGALYDELTDLVGNYDEASDAARSGAAVDRSRRDDGKRVNFDGTLVDLKAAAALYPNGQFS